MTTNQHPPSFIDYGQPFDQEDPETTRRVWSSPEDQATLIVQTRCPLPEEYESSAAFTAAYLEYQTHEHRMRQVWRNIRGSIYLHECGVSEACVDDYLASNKPTDPSRRQLRLWRFDAWTQLHFWDAFLVLVSILTVVGFGIVAVHAEINESSAVGFIIFLIGIGGITAEVIRRG